MSGEYLRRILEGRLTREELEKLPSGFQRIGHVAVLSLPRELWGRRREIGEALLGRNGIRTVAARTGGVEGRERRPSLEVVAGDPSTVTLHREHGCLFRLDPLRVMFSPGNLHERGRLPKLVRPGEVVVDLFAGVGQFSIPLARLARPSRVYAVELNPVAYAYLCENVRLNGVGEVVVPLLGDCEEVAPRGVADRVILGILHVTHRYLPLAGRVLKSSGGFLHYHESVPAPLQFSRPVQRVRGAFPGREVEILGVRRVKKYSPGVVHVVVDARVGPEREATF
ncbi:MAG: class I SAM-dependent methyltransferase family protein [Candidatus Hadarchaeales archaeon]